MRAAAPAAAMAARAGAGASAGPANEESVLYMDDEEQKRLCKEIRDKVTTQYTTVALVSALLSGVSFAAYSTPPGQLFTATGAAPTLSPPPAPGAGSSDGGAPPPHMDFWQRFVHFLSVIPWDTVLNVFYSLLWHVYGIVMPLAFVFNLLGTLTASGVILYANSTLATDHAVLKQFNDREAEHAIIKFPAAFLVFGVLFLFAGFSIGITLFYGIVVGLLLNVGIVATVIIYEMYFAPASHGDAFSEMMYSIAALFFRSCCADWARKADAIYAVGLRDKEAARQRAAVARAMAEAERKAAAHHHHGGADAGADTRAMRDKRGCC